MSSYPPPDNEPPNYAQPDQPYSTPPNYPQPDQPYGVPPSYPQPDQPYGAPPNYPPPANPYGAPPNYPPPANPYGTPPGYAVPAQQYGAQPNYAQPYGMPYPVGVPPNNGLAIASLILGILILVAGPFTGIPAVITGHMALSRTKANPMVPGRGMAIAGLILGYISIALTVCFIGAIIVAAANGGGSINTTS
jgi:hypothetical protein